MATERVLITQPRPEAKPLHLRPRSRSAQRVWCVGAPPTPAPAADPSEVRLAVAPDGHESFASLRLILGQLKGLALPGRLGEIERVEDYIREAYPDAGAGDEGSHGRLMADSVAFAIMRRISRESFYTARVIELGARTINAVLSDLPRCRSAHVGDVDRLDRPTLKVLARAALILEPSHGFSWVWHSAGDPLRAPSAGAEDIFLRSRRGLLRQLAGILAPTFVRRPGASPLCRPAAPARKPTPFDIAAALVVQNYDACFLWCDSLLGGTAEEVAEGRRLRALAAVNVGEYDEALESLRLAGESSGSGARRAHLSYLQGLIETKRRYDLSGSNAHYVRGLGLLDGCRGAEGEDPDLERAWLMNGLALNESVLWRRAPARQEHYARAFALERDAFALVRDGDGPARTYLRFNLLANSAFLLEMSGRHGAAIDTFLKVFEVEPDASPDRAQVWRSTLGYRVGVLHHGAGTHEQALRLLGEAAEYDPGPEGWPTHERVLRALGAVQLHRGLYREAAGTFARGLGLCRAGRSAQGTAEHGRGLIVSLLRGGEAARARDFYEELLAEEGLEAVPPEAFDGGGAADELRVSPLSPKLPAYFPELDLEGIPAIDLNLFLGKPEASAGGRKTPWGE